MKLWVTRHGQTDYNKEKLMQGRTDIELNETGVMQARKARQAIGDMHFDAVYASPLIRAIVTAEIIGDVKREDIIIDDRIIETCFGPYEGKGYTKMGIPMSLYWAYPEIFPAPKGVESVTEMILRTTDFLKEIESKDYENVLVVCHGGILRPICGYLEDKKNGIRWRPKPKNCEIRVYESNNGLHDFVAHYDIGS